MSNTQVRDNLSAYAIALLTFVVIAPAREVFETYVTPNIQAKGTKSILAGAILIPITVLLTAILIPPAFAQVYGANTSGWNSAVVVVFQILFPVLAIIAVVYSYIKEIS
jgi:hypothetical protein